MEHAVRLARRRFQEALGLLTRLEVRDFLARLILHEEGYEEAPPPPEEELLRRLVDYGLVLAQEEGGFRPSRWLVEFFHEASKGYLRSFVDAGKQASEVLGAFARAEETLEGLKKSLEQKHLNNALNYLRRHREVLGELDARLRQIPEGLRQLVRVDVEAKLADGRITLTEAWARLWEVQEKAGVVQESLERLDRGRESLEARWAPLREHLAGVDGPLRAEWRRAEEALLRLRTTTKAKAAKDIDDAIRFFQRLDETLARQVQARREVWERLERLTREGLEGMAVPLFSETPRFLVPAEERWGALRLDWTEAPEEPLPLQVLEPEAVFAEEAEPETLRELAEAFLASSHPTLRAFAAERGLSEPLEDLLALYLYERGERGELKGLRFVTESDGWTLWLREVRREEASGYPGEAEAEGAMPA
ncbi:hypothetical protein TJA_19370 [Thermus sp. LT1-2-5]|uniref:hypothetical protein n=1 Tax=Thermus sp. LT1-2-5 TaxID=3026935 RepID=UPI0030E82B71